MSELLHKLILDKARATPNAAAVKYKEELLSYAELAEEISKVAQGLLHIGLARNERAAVFLPKKFETVTSFFGISYASGVFVPINPLLKPDQVGYILKDCNVRVLVTSIDRAKMLEQTLAGCHDLNTVILTGDQTKGMPNIPGVDVLSWQELTSFKESISPTRIIDSDMASILYTSGSTGKPKGVVLSHRNMVIGAHSVAEYLQNTSSDRLLAVLPFSFDYGLSQLTTAFSVGASVVLMDYLLPRDVVRIVAREGVTGLAAVPPLWTQIASLPWPEEAQESLRYITNSGGAMPKLTLDNLKAALPKTTPFLMYGLTEAFRSTYLDPDQIDKRPDSMGKAIPNAEVMVVREDGTACSPGEPGELVHRGPLVAMGYWNDKEKTAERFRPAPGRESGITLEEIAVWSGDTVRMDEDGFLYFIGRKDDMIKTSGYRVSPTEVEEVVYSSGLVEQVAALGIPHPNLGQAVVLVVSPPATHSSVDAEAVTKICKMNLPGFMVPAYIHVQQELPRNPNGKINRKQLSTELQELFQENNS